MIKFLLKPFERYSENTLIPIGVVFMLVGSYFGSVCQAHFDGVLDLHFSNENVSFISSLLENTINVSVLSVCLFIVGRIVNNKTRIVDLLSTVLIARIPFYFGALFNISGTYSFGDASDIQKTIDFASNHIGSLIMLTLSIILLIIWMIALLFNGYKVSTNAKGMKANALFVLAIIVSEILSKISFYYLKF